MVLTVSGAANCGRRLYGEWAARGGEVGVEVGVEGEGVRWVLKVGVEGGC